MRRAMAEAQRLSVREGHAHNILRFLDGPWTHLRERTVVEPSMGPLPGVVPLGREWIARTQSFGDKVRRNAYSEHYAVFDPQHLGGEEWFSLANGITTLQATLWGSSQTPDAIRLSHPDIVSATGYAEEVAKRVEGTLEVYLLT